MKLHGVLKEKLRDQEEEDHLKGDQTGEAPDLELVLSANAAVPGAGLPVVLNSAAVLGKTIHHIDPDDPLATPRKNPLKNNETWDLTVTP